MIDHRQIDARSLAFGRAIAERIKANPALIEDARSNLLRWMKTCSPRSRSTLEEWSTILNGPFEDVIDTLTQDTERATRLRQSSPFAGILPQDERNEILLQFKSNDPAAT